MVELSVGADQVVDGLLNLAGAKPAVVNQGRDLKCVKRLKRYKKATALKVPRKVEA